MKGIQVVQQVIMKFLNTMILLFGMLGASLSANMDTSATPVADEALIPLSTEELELAEPAWDRFCAKCHGEDGNGPASRMGERLGLKINYAEPGALDGFTDEQLDTITAEGMEGTRMNGFAKRLSPEEIRALTRYMRSMGNR